MSSGWAEKHHGEILTVEQIKNIYDLPEEDHCDYKDKVEALTWYVDEYLPAAAPNYTKDFRTRKLMTAGVEVWDQNTTAVPLQSEAFGQLMYDNCYEKWKALARERQINPRFEAPKYKKKDKHTWEFHSTKYSDRNAGKGQGWNEETSVAHNKCVVKVKEFRTDDKENKYKILKLVRDLIRKKHGLQHYQDLKRKRGACEEGRRVGRHITVHQEVIVLSDNPDDGGSEEEDSSRGGE
jgi:hypothetical protein